MRDVGIIGGGLSGLASAAKLFRRGRDIIVFEARDRRGVRILTVSSSNGSGLDLGAKWHWPKTEPLLAQLVEELGLAHFAVNVENGRTSLTPCIPKPFGDLIQAIVDDVIVLSRTSCALSNFPGERQLSKDYLQAILQDIAAARREFSLSANRLLLGKINARFKFMQEKAE